MRRLALISLIPLTISGSAAAQMMDHSTMPGMAMPAEQPKPAKKSKAKAKSSHGHAATKGPAASTKAAASSHSGHSPPGGMTPNNGSMTGMSMPTSPGALDHSSMPGMSTPSSPSPADKGTMGGMNMGSMAGHDMPAASEPEIPKSPPPPPPTAPAADHFYPSAAMAAARAQLRREHGGGAVPYSKVMANLAEYQFRNGADGYRWDGQAWFGGDIHRLVLKSEGEGTRGQGVESAELQALYSRALGVYTDVQVGVRQAFAPHGRTYATVGFETLFPYWFDFEGAAFLSSKGDLLGRVEGAYDVRLTNRLILQPRAELNLAAQDTPETQTGSGVSNAELGLRLRYEIRREFAPYVGVSWDRKFGKTADYARAAGEDAEATSLVVGVRAFF